VQVNGKKRDEIAIPASLDPKTAKAEIEALALACDAVVKQLAGAAPKRVVYVPGKLVNLVL
jgi:leucyl-tRNA synthetase